MKRIFTFLFSLATVGVFAQCSIGLTDQAATCNAASDGAITSVPAGGTVYTYLWSNGETTQNISGIGAGTYSVTMIADGTCTVTESATVTEPAALVADLVQESDQCFIGNSFSFDATGSTDPQSISTSPNLPQYLWNYGDGNTASGNGANAHIRTHSYVTPGTYTVALTVTDGNCPETTSITITAFEEPSITMTGTDITCFGLSDGNIAVNGANGSTPYTYTWSGPAGFAAVNTSGSSFTETGLDVGTYDLTITDNSGQNCSSTATVTVNEPTALSISVSDNQPTCTGGATDGEASVSASGGPSTNYTYAWSNASSNDTISDLMGGSYHITVTSGSCSAIDSVSLESAMEMNYTVTASICDGETFNAGGGAQDTSGMYVDIYTTANGCDSIVTTDLTVYALPTAEATVSDDSICEGDVVTLSASGPGGSSFAWDNASVLDNANVADPVATPANGVTTFNVTVSKNGCSSEASITINTVISPVVNVTQFVNTDECLDTLRINANTSATVFNWTTPYGTQSTSLLEKIILITNSAQVYSVMGVDDFGCASDEEVVNVSAGLACSPISIEEITAGSMHLWPNPNNGSFDIQFANTDTKVIRVIDVTGKSIYSAVTNDLNTTIDLDVSTGIYFLEMTANNSLVIEKIIVE